MLTLKCECCGEPFQYKNIRKYCSRSCYNKYVKEHKGTGTLPGPSKKEKVEVVCAYCGKHEKSFSRQVKDL